MKTILALSLIAAVGAVASSEAKTPSPSDFLAQHLHLTVSPSSRSADVDLNGDGRRETLVYVTDSRFCGSGGCNLYVLSPRGASYRLMMRATLVQLPIRILSSSSHGWRDIGVTVNGDGIVGSYEAVLCFDGRRYPGNPKAPPARRLTRTAGEVLIGP